MKTFDFELSEPVEYSAKGDVTTGSKIVCYAPKPSQRSKVMKLKQIFFQSLPKTNQQKTESKEQESSEITGSEVLFVVAQSDASYPDFIELGRSIICDRNAKIDDAEYITTAIIDKISLDDLELLVGGYVANFIVNAALKSLTKS